MIPRRIEADRAKGADTEAAPFSSIVSMESFSHRASPPPSRSPFLSLLLSLFSPVPLHADIRVYTENDKKDEISKGTRSTASDECRNQLATMFSLRRCVYALLSETSPCAASLRVPTFQPLAKPRLNPCTSSAYTAYCGVQR